ncbi:MAG: hypothetical protein R3225_09340 [Halofilum sp. (in: g-proteobacteria)]|nr:hypothetical protein [Halofilum sp. (in: g-proteobacteria)]
MTKRIALAAVLLAAPALGWAQEHPGLYWGVNFGGYELDQEDVGLTVENSTDFGLRLGFQLGGLIGVEFRGGLDAGDPDVDIQYAGAFWRLNLPFEKTNVYLLGGVSEVRSGGNAVDDDVYDPVAAGVGIELYGSPRSAISLEYMNYSDSAYSGISLGYKYHFELPSFRP